MEPKGDTMKIKWIVIIALLAILVIVGGGSCAGKYNMLVTLNENVKTSWSQVENVMQRRADLIPNLVNAVKGYAAHEEEVLTEVTNARAKVGQASTVPDKIAANSELSSALSRLLVVAERYPDLKANQNFISLQDELAGTENRITVERMRYNDSVRQYNTYVRIFPNNIIASILGYSREDIYFKADEGSEKAPVVDFGKSE